MDRRRFRRDCAVRAGAHASVTTNAALRVNHQGVVVEPRGFGRSQAFIATEMTISGCAVQSGFNNAILDWSYQQAFVTKHAAPIVDDRGR